MPDDMSHRDRTEALAVWSGIDARFSGRCCGNAADDVRSLHSRAYNEKPAALQARIIVFTL